MLHLKICIDILETQNAIWRQKMLIDLLINDTIECFNKTEMNLKNFKYQLFNTKEYKIYKTQFLFIIIYTCWKQQLFIY